MSALQQSVLAWGHHTDGTGCFAVLQTFYAALDHVVPQVVQNVI